MLRTSWRHVGCMYTTAGCQQVLPTQQLTANLPTQCAARGPLPWRGRLAGTGDAGQWSARSAVSLPCSQHQRLHTAVAGAISTSRPEADSLYGLPVKSSFPVVLLCGGCLPEAAGGGVLVKCGIRFHGAGGAVFDSRCHGQPSYMAHLAIQKNPTRTHTHTRACCMVWRCPAYSVVGACCLPHLLLPWVAGSGRVPGWWGAVISQHQHQVPSSRWSETGSSCLGLGACVIGQGKDVCRAGRVCGGGGGGGTI
jgi:hypothetical protein